MTAAAADSVAVNQPSRIPPTMMNGVISAGIEMAAARTNWSNVARGYVG